MYVKNSFEYDARVTKEAASLAAAGHDVTVVAIHLPGVTARRETALSGVDVVRVTRLHDRIARLMPASTVAPGAGRPAGPRRRGGAGARALRTVLWRAEPVLGWPLRALNTLVLNARFVRAGLDTRAEVFHAHDLNTLRIGAVSKAKSNGRLVYDSHELHTHRNEMGVLRRTWASLLEHRGIRQSDAVIAATETWADYLTGMYGVPRPTVVRNVPELAEPEPGWDLRAHLGLASDVRVLLYQGSIQRNRGLEQIIDALALLDRCALVVVGYGAYRPRLEQMVARRGLGAQVRFLGPVRHDELLNWTAGADVGMCCVRNSSLSYYSSLPNKVFEYMLAGIPVVASDFPEMGRVVRDERVGEVCDPDDPASIAAAVRRIVDDPDHAARCREHAGAAIARHHWGLEQRKLLELYAQLEAFPRLGSSATSNPAGRSLTRRLPSSTTNRSGR